MVVQGSSERWATPRAVFALHVVAAVAFRTGRPRAVSCPGGIDLQSDWPKLLHASVRPARIVFVPAAHPTCEPFWVCAGRPAQSLLPRPCERFWVKRTTTRDHFRSRAGIVQATRLVDRVVLLTDAASSRLQPPRLDEV